MSRVSIGKQNSGNVRDECHRHGSHDLGHPEQRTLLHVSAGNAVCRQNLPDRPYQHQVVEQGNRAGDELGQQIYRRPGEIGSEQPEAKDRGSDAEDGDRQRLKVWRTTGHPMVLPLPGFSRLPPSRRTEDTATTPPKIIRTLTNSASHKFPARGASYRATDNVRNRMTPPAIPQAPGNHFGSWFMVMSPVRRDSTLRWYFRRLRNLRSRRRSGWRRRAARTPRRRARA